MFNNGQIHTNYQIKHNPKHLQVTVSVRTVRELRTEHK